MEDILDGILFYNPKREFTTNPKESRANIIYQRGNIYNYARNELLLSRAGLNRQITGIYGRTNVPYAMKMIILTIVIMDILALFG